MITTANNSFEQITDIAEKLYPECLIIEQPQMKTRALVDEVCRRSMPIVASC